MHPHRAANIACLTLLGAMALSPLAAAPNQSQASPNAKQQLLDLEQVWIKAEHNRDAATLRRILDEKFVATFGAGKPYDKEAFIQAILSETPDPTESQTLAYDTVIVDGDTAVTVGTDTEHGTKNGAPYTDAARYTATYIRRHGQWLALAEHLVEVPQPK